MNANENADAVITTDPDGFDDSTFNQILTNK